MSAAADTRPAWAVPLAEPKGRIIGGHVLNKTVFGVVRERGWCFDPERVFEWSSALLVLPPEGVNLTYLTRRILDAMEVEAALSAAENERRRLPGERVAPDGQCRRAEGEAPQSVAFSGPTQGSEGGS